MDNLTIDEKCIIDSAFRICQRYHNSDLTHDGHEIFRMARDAAEMMLHYELHPLACRIANDLVKQSINLYRAAHAA